MMRGGTSKGLFFMENDLPSDPSIRDQVILKVYGSPDSYGRQTDGMGGGTPTSSKVAIISKSTDPNYDVIYHFGQVAIDKPVIDYTPNCGNISAAVGPFAVDQGLVDHIMEPITTVRIHQKNTNKLIVAEVPVKNGQYDEAGDYEINGIPGTGGKITLKFAAPGGSITGKLFPTGNKIDTLSVPGLGEVRITFLDAANPVVMVPASEIGLTGTELKEINGKEIQEKLEAIRCAAAVAAGMAKTPEEASQKSQAIPKITLIAPPQDYIALNGKKVSATEIDLTVRYIAMGTLHSALAVSGGIAIAGAALIEGTVAHELMRDKTIEEGVMLLGHPGGIIDIGPNLEESEEGPFYVEAAVGRTARRLMEGRVLVPESAFV